MDEIIIRDYKEGDENQILTFRNQLLPSKRSLDHWKWQFINNIHGNAVITLAERGGALVGHYAVMRNNINYNGECISTGQSCDTMVSQDYRNKKLFIDLAKINYERARDNKMVAVFGFPNRRSFHGFMKYLEWHRIVSLKYFYARIGLRQIWGTHVDRAFKELYRIIIKLRFKLMGFNSSDIEIRCVKSIPAALSDALDQILKNNVLSLWKDMEYLRWRYEQHPTNEYQFHVLLDHGVEEGLIVTRQVGDIIAICEVLHKSNDVAKTALLLLQVMISLCGTKCQKIEYFGHDNGFFEAVFIRCGFEYVPYSDYIFCGRVFDDAFLADFILYHNWTISYGDTDVI